MTDAPKLRPDAQLVGATFEPDRYGFGLPLRSELTRPLTLAIVATHENDALENLRLKYFSDTH